MFFSVPIRSVKEAVAYVLDLTPARTSAGLAPNILLEALQDNTVHVFFNDSDIAVSNKFEASVEEAGSALISLPTLHSVLSSFFVSNREGSLLFKLSDNNLVVETQKKEGSTCIDSRRVFPIYGGFTGKVETPPEEKFSWVPIRSLFDGIKKILPSLAGDSASGVLFVLKSNTIRMAATNGITLSEYVIQFSGDVPEVFCVLSSSFVGRLNKILAKLMKSYGKDSNVGIYFNRGLFGLLDGSLFVAVSVAGTDFVDYGSVFSGFSNSISIPTKLFYDSIRSISSAAPKDDNFRVSLRFENDTVSVFSQGSYNAGVPVVGLLEPFIIDFNATLLESVVRVLDVDNFTFKYKEPKKPVLVNSSDGGCTLNIVVAPLQ